MCIRRAARERPATQPYYWKSHISGDSLRYEIFWASTIWHARLSIIRLWYGKFKVGSGRLLCQNSPAKFESQQLCKAWQQLLNLENLLYPWAYYAVTPYLLLCTTLLLELHSVRVPQSWFGCSMESSLPGCGRFPHHTSRHSLLLASCKFYSFLTWGLPKLCTYRVKVSYKVINKCILCFLSLRCLKLWKARAIYLCSLVVGAGSLFWIQQTSLNSLLRPRKRNADTVYPALHPELIFKTL